MGTYTQLIYQIVFSTKHREKTLIENERQKLYKYIWGILKNENCHLYRINGVEDHIHIVTHIHPTISLAGLVKDIKVASSKHIKDNSIFPNFHGWQDGYAAFTYSYNALDNLIKYVINQEEHHQKMTFVDELKSLLKEHHIPYDPKYLL